MKLSGIFGARVLCQTLFRNLSCVSSTAIQLAFERNFGNKIFCYKKSVRMLVECPVSTDALSGPSRFWCVRLSAVNVSWDIELFFEVMQRPTKCWGGNECTLNSVHFFVFPGGTIFTPRNFQEWKSSIK